MKFLEAETESCRGGPGRRAVLSLRQEPQLWPMVPSQVCRDGDRCPGMRVTCPLHPSWHEEAAAVPQGHSCQPRRVTAAGLAWLLVPGLSLALFTGNGPSGICLSYLLSGHTPYVRPDAVHPHPLLQRKLAEAPGVSILDQVGGAVPLPVVSWWGGGLARATGCMRRIFPDTSAPPQGP